MSIRSELNQLTMARIFEYVEYDKIVLQDKLKLNKQVSIELEDGTVLQRDVFGIKGKIDNFYIKILCTDLKVEDEKENVIILQLDNLTIYALKVTDEKNRAFCCYENEKWVELSDLLLTKLLVGIEHLNEMFIKYEPLTEDYEVLYQQLVGFLNYDQAAQLK